MDDRECELLLPLRGMVEGGGGCWTFEGGEFETLGGDEFETLGGDEC